MSFSAELKRAVDAFQRGDFDKARALAQSGLASAPSPELQHLLGLIHCRMGNAAQGVAHLRSAVDAQPDNRSFQIMLARALIDSGRATEVLALPKPTNATSTAEAALWHVRAEAAVTVGDRQAAIEAWSNVCRASPSNHRPWVQLGRSYLSQSRYADAELAYQRALEIAPKDLDALQELGLTYNRTGQWQRLRDLLDRSLEEGVAPDSLTYLWALRHFRDNNLPAAMERLAGRPRGVDRPRWHSLRAKIAEAAGDSDAAFDAAQAMNRDVPNSAA